MVRCSRLAIAGFAALCHHSAALLGTQLRDGQQRRRRFLLVALGLFVLAALLPARVALAILAASLWLLGAVSFAWGANEKQRGRIAKKIDNTLPDSLPDLRDLALLTGLALLLFLPLLFEKAQGCFDLFGVEGRPSWLAWLGFLVDKIYLRPLPDAIDLGFTRLERLHAADIDYYPGEAGYPGRGLVLFAYALLYLVLLQGLVRLWQIGRDVEEGILGVASDHDMAVRLGRRAVRPLLREWQKPDLPDATRANMARALGLIRDVRAFPVLRAAALDRACPLPVRQAALAALGNLNHPQSVDVLQAVLADDSDLPMARAAAAVGLGLLSDHRAAGPLLDKLERIQAGNRFRDTANVRKEVVRALGLHLERRLVADPDEARDLVERAIDLLLGGAVKRSLLQDA